MSARFITLFLFFSVTLFAIACGSPRTEEPAPVPGKSLEDVKSEVFGGAAEFDKRILAGGEGEAKYTPPAQRPEFGSQ
ncbi:MAG: hypothetical protein L0213_08020, partial [Candidatus Dadabacteria bacterium]|nr:hypothetical protein [Candidatus Dadabacteria bacterium]